MIIHYSHTVHLITTKNLDFYRDRDNVKKKTLTSDKETIEGKKPRKLTNNKSMKNLMNTKTTAMSEITAITQQNIGGTP